MNDTAVMDQTMVDEDNDTAAKEPKKRKPKAEKQILVPGKEQIAAIEAELEEDQYLLPSGQIVTIVQSFDFVGMFKLTTNKGPLVAELQGHYTDRDTLRKTVKAYKDAMKRKFEEE